MPDCNIRNIDLSLMRDMKAKAAAEGLTLRKWCIKQFSLGIAVPDEIATALPKQWQQENKPMTPFLEEAEPFYIPTLDGKRHDVKACRVYRCAQCIAMGRKF